MTKIINRHTCCICSKKRLESAMTRVSWYYSPFPKKVVVLNTWACTKALYVFSGSCLSAVNRLKDVNLYAGSQKVSSGVTSSGESPP
jgi:hypothetical protein